MDAKKVRRSYDLPVNLVNYFKNWKPGRDLSPKVAGAILHFMTLDSETRDKCEELAYSDNVGKTLESLKSQSRVKLPVLPIQPEERAALMPAQDLHRFLEQLVKDNPNIILETISQALIQPAEDDEPVINKCIDVVHEIATRYKIPNKAQQQLIASIRKLHGPDPEKSVAEVEAAVARELKRANTKRSGA